MRTNDKEIILHTRTHTRKRRRVAHVCVTWYVACINGTRRGLRMTLSGKCSELCIVIPVEYRRWRLYRTYIHMRVVILHPPTLSNPIDYFLRFFVVSTPALECPMKHARSFGRFVFVLDAAVTPTTARPLSLITFRWMRALRLLLGMHLHKR